MRNYGIDSEDGNALTTERVDALRREAGQAGDLRMVATCDDALAGDRAALAKCAAVIADAAAMRDAGALARGVRRLDAVRLASGALAYFDEGMGLWYVATEDEVRSLALDYLDSPDPAIQGDAYSHWCAGVVALEATAEQIAEVTTWAGTK